MAKTKYVLCVILLLLLCACSTWRKLNATEQGAVIGTGTGAAIGAIATDSAGGALIGGGLGAVGGGVLGHLVDKENKRR